MSTKPAVIPPLPAALVDKATGRWRQGGHVIFPTETVYGLGADAANEAAVAEIFEIKARPQEKSIIVHVVDAAMAKRYVQWNDAAEKLAAAFWPGPLTFVLPRKGGEGAKALAAGDTLAVRAPSHPAAQQLIRAFGSGIAGTSANRSGNPSPLTLAQAQAELGQELLGIDGGACEVGLASTVLDLTGSEPRILRQGSISQHAIMDCLHHNAS